jgi:hypothetical protein
MAWDDGGVVAGLTPVELASRTGHDRRVLEIVMREEVARGRVSFEDGVFALRPGALPVDVAQALHGLTPPDVAVPANGGRRRRPSGGGVSAAERRNLII